MRLLFLQCDSIFESYGGIEYYLDDLLCTAVDVLGPGSVHTLVPRRRTTWHNGGRPYGVTAVPLSSHFLVSKVTNRFSPRYFRAALATARAQRPNYLVSAHVSLGPMAALLSAFTGIPYLSCVYGYEAWGGLMPQDEWALRRSHAILSISHWTKNLLVARGYDATQIEIAHPRLDDRLEHRPLPPATNSDTLRLLTVSRLDANEQYKGHDHVLHALDLLRARAPELKIQYTIQGDGNDRGRLERLTKEWNLEDRVRFTGRVKDRVDLDGVYAAHDVFVMPSRFGKWERRWRGEGFGIVFLEAAAFGVPSIAYDCGGVTDIIEHEKTGLLVAPDDISALANAIERLARNPQKRRELGTQAYAQMHERFTRPAIHSEIAQGLERISKRSPGKSIASRSPQPAVLP